jgi:hypothetical protein
MAIIGEAVQMSFSYYVPIEREGGVTHSFTYWKGGVIHSFTFMKAGGEGLRIDFFNTY